jgi:hypothetical protein
MILQTALEAIEGGTQNLSDLVALCSRETPLDEEAAVDGIAPFEYLIYLLEESGEVKVLDERDLVVLYAELLDGLVLTHLVGAEEISSGLVNATPDLIGIDTDIDPLPLLAGGSMSLEFNDDDSRFHEHGSFVGPEGWLSRFEPGDLVAFTRVGETLRLDAVTIPGDASEEVLALAEAYESLGMLPEAGAEPYQILEMALVDNPGLFRRSLLPLEELLVAAGLEMRGAWAGPKDEEWGPPGIAMVEELIKHVEVSFDMDSCCVEAFRVATGHWRDPDNSDGVEAAKALGHGSVADAFVDWYDRFLAVEAETFGDYLRDLIVGAGRHAAPVRYVYAVHLDAIGDAISSEAELDTAVRSDPEFSSALWMLAWFASDRGDATRAVSLLQRAGVDPDDPDLEYHRSLVSEQPGIGRNDPCPCGSGRKFKVCHLDNPILEPQVRVDWMLRKVNRYMHAHYRHDRYIGPALSALPEGFEPEDFRRMAGNAFIIELSVFEGGGIEDFLVERGALLPAEERDLYDLWTQATLALWEIVSVSGGETVDLRDTRTGEHVEIFDRSVASHFSAGEMILARPLPSFGTTGLSAAVVPIDLRLRDSLLRLLDGDVDAESFAYWYGGLFDPPTLQTTEGEPFVMSEARLKPTRSWAGLERVLDRLYQSEGDGVWTSLHTPGPDDAPIVRASLTRSGDHLEVSTVAVERLDRVLTELDGEVEVVERTESEMDWGATPSEEALSGRVDLDPEVREEIIEMMENKWLGESIPALGGVTPREAVDDPTRRDDLFALLRQFGDPDQTGPAMTMCASSLRRKLGIADD